MRGSPHKTQRKVSLAWVGVSWLAMASIAHSQDMSEAVENRPTLNFYGVTGAIDTPTALSQPDGQLSTTVSHFAGITRSTLTFQIFPRVEGSFRYTKFADLNFQTFNDYYDRSFDISLRILDESRYLPALKIGLQDFIGTGLSAAEYVVATKTYGDRLTVSGGLGWGRLASYNDLGSPFGDRPNVVVGTGGKANTDQWFRGPVAPFASITYKATDKITLLAEYSSDNYETETNKSNVPTTPMFDRKSPLNFGVDYKINSAVNLGAYYMYGDTLGVNLNISLNPNAPPARGTGGVSPQPVVLRPSRSQSPGAWAEEWALGSTANDRLLAALHRQMEPQGIIIETLAATGDSVQVTVRTNQFDYGPQMIGRVLRGLTAVMPASVETFHVIPSASGVGASTVTVRRSDVEALEHSPNGAARLLAVTGFANAPAAIPAEAARNADYFPKFQWSLGPYIRQSYFDPDNPFRFEAGARLKASYEPTPGLILSGSITKAAVGNLENSRRLSNSVLPHVRTDGVLYDKQGDPALETLTAAYYFKPGEDLYARVTGGYLERMFGGLSGEVLWRPAGSRFALGAELNYAKKRDFDLRFGFQDYDVVTGHVSAYYQMDNGFHAQLDVGRYLAGDLGATLKIDREFTNGWRIGAFATLTDVSAADFGEGSFDKGITLEIPVSWFLGTPNTYKMGTTVRPITRDGGARLNVSGRLYDQVRHYQRPTLENQWGRVWQ
ncbi:YjbH domain-containing protein [Oceaniglobus ichthyenteri]|uniref:YjbH domain-containing protein n=1 Tax=Oceaniglobus ichthyenteri TaxID=2136177 RepID=UPI000D351244|nr:YjbH domain-containing protein [Oceaniglobus ichthyenteri]